MRAVTPLFDRAAMLQRLRDESFDVVVVGGGITGVGVALDAASRGLRTALVERDDFASGTSSKSSKLVHGGLRYLQQGEVRLVYEALHERQRLRKNAPHLVRVLPFLIPILGKAQTGEAASTKSVVSRKIARAMGSAMWMYDLTGGWRIGKLHRRLRKASALAHMPTMPESRLLSAYLYYDATVDDARLVVTVARTAAQHGAVVANRCRVIGFASEGERVSGVTVSADGDEFTIAAKVVVNASGVWSDDVRSLDEATNPDSIRPAKGVHLTVPWHKVRNDIAVVIPVPKDKRSLFVVPWGANGDGTFQHTYVGTTDTDYTGPLDDPQCTGDDIAYVLRALNASIDPSFGGVVSVDDVTGVWAGLRPLVKRAESGRTADLSRRHSVTTNPHGIITVTGGKLTTYREMAEDTVDEVVKVLGGSQRCRTKRLHLAGADGYRDGTPGTVDAHLRSRFGSSAAEVQRLVDADATMGEHLVPGLPYLRAEAVYAARHEMARTLDDVLSRRTRARLLDRAATLAAAPAVAELIGAELGWDQDETQQQIAAFAASVGAEQAAGMVTETEFIAHVVGGSS